MNKIKVSFFKISLYHFPYSYFGETSRDDIFEVMIGYLATLKSLLSFLFFIIGKQYHRVKKITIKIATFKNRQIVYVYVY